MHPFEHRTRGGLGISCVIKVQKLAAHISIIVGRPLAPQIG